MNYIVFLCYGHTGVLHECAYALLSLSRLYFPGALDNTEIWIYTDNPGFFQSFKECPLPLHFRKIDEQTIKQWRGEIQFSHRAKIEMLREFSKDRNGNILYVDSDCVFICALDEVFENIGNGNLYMHVMEGVVSDKGNPLLKKLDTYLRKDPAKEIKGKPIHNMAMWNAGVLGFNTGYKGLLDEVLAFTDNEYPRFPKHIVEQFAFSVYFQATKDVKAAAPHIMHYWNLKEARTELASFFDYFKNASWNELTEASQLIQMHVMIQEKLNFCNNRNIVQALQKTAWTPVKRNWEDLMKQL